MKKLTLSILTILLTASTIQAQRNGVDDLERENFFRIGFKGTANVNKIPGKSYKDGFYYNYQLGGFMQFNFSKRFGIQPEVNMTQASYDFDTDAQAIWDDLFRDGTQKNGRMNYMEIPILLNINAGESRHVKLQVGPSYGFYTQEVDRFKEGYIYKNGEFSMHGGFWIQLPFIHIGARYKMGLSKVSGEIDHTNQTWRNQAIQVFIGGTF